MIFMQPWPVHSSWRGASVRIFGYRYHMVLLARSITIDLVQSEFYFLIFYIWYRLLYKEHMDTSDLLNFACSLAFSLCLQAVSDETVVFPCHTAGEGFRFPISFSQAIILIVTSSLNRIARALSCRLTLLLG
jgi:hypothetical protein